MATIQVGPGRTFTRLGAVSPVPSAGDIVEVDPGVFNPSVDADTLTSWLGTSGNPIIVRPAISSKPPVFKREIRLTNCTYVTIENIRVDYPTTTAPALAPCITINGSSSSHVSILNCHTRGGLVGVQLNSGCGLGHRVEGNTIRSTQKAAASFTAGNGIAVSEGNYGTGHTRATRCAEIVGNRIYSAAGHGMELQGRYGLVYGNLIKGAGTLIRGCSGIHVLNADRLNSDPDGTTVQGRDWHVVNNIVCDVKTATLDDGNGFVFQQDGNGIQVDHGCEDVMIQGNICFNNDGSGIAVFDAANGQVWFNTCYNNFRDKDGQHIHRSEITFGSDENVTPTYLSTWSCVGNVAVAFANSYLDGGSNYWQDNFSLIAHVTQQNYNIPVAVPSITYGYNNFYRASGSGNPYRIIGTTYANISTWNAARPTATDMGADIATDPGFAGPFTINPLGWEPTGSTATLVADIPAGVLYRHDMLGRPIPATNAAAGAIQVAP